MGRGFIFRGRLPRRGHLSRQGPESPPTYAVLAVLSNCCPPPVGRLSTCYAPVRHFTRRIAPSFSFDLHVLSPPLTFALSQDQTLQLNFQTPSRSSAFIFDLIRPGAVPLGLLITQGFGAESFAFRRKLRSSTIFSICYSAFRDRLFRFGFGLLSSATAAAGSGILSISENLSTNKVRRRCFFLCCRLRGLREQVRGLFGVITHDQIGACPTHRKQSFHHGPFVVKEALLGGCF